MHFKLSIINTMVYTALIGEVVTTQDAIGGGLIILGCLVNEMDLLGKLRGAWLSRVHGGGKKDKTVHSA